MPASEKLSRAFATTSSSSSNPIVSRIGVAWLELIVGVALCGAVYYAPAVVDRPTPAATGAVLKTGGTSVVALIIENRWRGMFQKEKGIKLDYDSAGSSEGVQRMIAAVVFASPISWPYVSPSAYAE